MQTIDREYHAQFIICQVHAASIQMAEDNEIETIEIDRSKCVPIWIGQPNEMNDRTTDWLVYLVDCLPHRHTDTPALFHETIDDYANIIRHLEFDVNKNAKKQKRNDFLVFDLIWSASASVSAHACSVDMHAPTTYIYSTAKLCGTLAHCASAVCWIIIVYYVHISITNPICEYTGMKNNNAKYVYGSQRSLLFHAWQTAIRGYVLHRKYSVDSVGQWYAPSARCFFRVFIVAGNWCNHTSFGPSLTFSLVYDFGRA